MYRRIKPHAPPLVRVPVYSFEFLILRPYSPGGTLNVLTALLQRSSLTTTSVHRLGRGLPGYLILFAPTLSHLSVNNVPVDRLRNRYSFWSLRILPYTRNSIYLSHILGNSFKSSSIVELLDFTSDLYTRLHALYAQWFRVTLAPSVLPRLLARS